MRPDTDVQRLLADPALNRYVCRRCLASCPSTNDEATRLAREGAPDGTIVVAESQTAGRGRQGRAWFSPAGRGLYVSVLFRPALPMERIPLIPLATGIAVAEALAALGVRDIGLKWPNDVQLGGRKVAGILCEHLAGPVPNRAGVVIVGLGVNLGGVDEDFPPELKPIATSVAAELGQPVTRTAVLGPVLAGLGPLLDALEQGEGLPWSRWQRFSVVEGREVRLDEAGGGVVHGRAIRVAEDGALVVRLADGTEERHMAGDVTVLPG